MEKGINCKISEKAEVDVSVNIKNNVVVHDDAKIGKDCIVGNNVVIYDGTIIGKSVRIDDNSVIGKRPMKAVTSSITKEEELEPAYISDDVLIGTNAVIYRGASIGNKCLVADMATIRENVSIGEKTIVGRGVAIENYCKIGSFCKLETNAYITAHSTLGDNVFIAPGVLTSNDNYLGRSKERFKHFKGVTVEKGGRIGVGAVIMPGKTIKEESVVAAGSILTNNTEPRKIYLGSPAKEFRDVPEDQLLENQ